MITQSNIHTVGLQQTLREGLPKAATNLLSIQRNVLINTYVRHTGKLEALLASNPYEVEVTDQKASLQVNYIAQIRFMDMKRTQTGKRKKRYAPIYNKYVWGFLMGYTYNLMRQGLRAELNRNLTETTLNISI